MALQFAEGPSKEIVISGLPNDVATKEMIRTVQTAYLPDAVIALDPRGDVPTTMKLFIPNVDEKEPAQAKKPVVYICENYACQAPISDLNQLKEALALNKKAAR
jgi:uncharacterized protein YyaL (SSP411 family)